MLLTASALPGSALNQPRGVALLEGLRQEKPPALCPQPSPTCHSSRGSDSTC